MSTATTPTTLGWPAGVGEDGARHPVLHHVNLLTTRMDAMVDWYGAIAGLEPTFRSANASFLTNDAASHRLALLSLPALADDPDKIGHAGIHHTAFEFASVEDLLARYRSLRDRGIAPYACLDHGPTLSFYYSDPDGNSVEFQSDNFGDWSQSAQFMRMAAEFAADPIGRYVDPELVLAASEGGMSRDEIHQRAVAGEFTTPTTPRDLRLPEA